MRQSLLIDTLDIIDEYDKKLKRLDAARQELLVALEEIDEQLSGTHIYENGFIGKVLTPAAVCRDVIAKHKAGKEGR